MAIEITQSIADELIKIEKEFESREIVFPSAGVDVSEDLFSIDRQHKFVVTVNRKGHIDLTKCSIQNRYEQGPIHLVRIDLGEGVRSHTNPPPDSRTIKGPHIHLYREGHRLDFAEPLSDFFSNVDISAMDRIDIFGLFCDYCNIRRNRRIISPIEGV
jgi:hypothetical protein